MTTFIAPAAMCATHLNQLGQERHTSKSIASTCAAVTAPASCGDQRVVQGIRQVSSADSGAFKLRKYMRDKGGSV